MPIHLVELDIISQAAGLDSALIVPCNICPAVSVATDQNKPFLRVFKDFLKCAPFEDYMKDLQNRLCKIGVRADVFRSDIPHQWFMCIWSPGQRTKLRRRAKNYDAVIPLGCDSANEIARSEAEPEGCKIIEGMEVAGITNAKLRISFPCNISFDDFSLTPIKMRMEEEKELY